MPEQPPHVRTPERNFMDPYIDLAAVVSGSETYTDFEGLADRTSVDQLLNHPHVQDRIALYGSTTTTDPVANDYPWGPTLKTLLLHYAYENLDQADYYVTVEEAITFIDTCHFILSSRWWLKDMLEPSAPVTGADMTTNEAKYVMAHREEYSDATVKYAMEILEAAHMAPWRDN